MQNIKKFKKKETHQENFAIITSDQSPYRSLWRCEIVRGSSGDDLPSLLMYILAIAGVVRYAKIHHPGLLRGLPSFLTCQTIPEAERRRSPWQQSRKAWLGRGWCEHS